MAEPSGGKLNISKKTRFLAQNALLAALALALSALELLIPPLPMLPPGAKLGLSNIVTMYAAGASGLVPALCIALLKGIFSGVTRGVTSLLMSLFGGIFSTLVMWLLLRIKSRPFGFIGLGVAGALSHNFAQLMVAMALTTPAIVYYIPWLILFGIASGIVTGMVLRTVMPLLDKLNLE